MQDKLLVMKFGGTSVGSAEAMSQVVKIVKESRSEWPNVIVVTSALSGITDMLLESIRKAVAGKTASLPQTAEAIQGRHAQIADALIDDTSLKTFILNEIIQLISEFTNLCNAISVLGEATPRAFDSVLSLGERMSVRLLTGAFQSQGIRAKSLEATKVIITDACFQLAHPDLENTRIRTRQSIIPLLENGFVPVITGFISGTPDGITTTLGRGGGDYSAALIAAVTQATELWIWTDVNGVMSADPRILPEAITIDELTFKEVAELAYFGAKVLHPKTIRPVIEAGIGLHVRNTFNPSHRGTKIVTDDQNQQHGIIKAVTIIKEQSLITIEGRGMLGVPGVAARTFAAVAATGTSVALISQASSEQSICFTTPVEATDVVIDSLEKAFTLELKQQDIDRVWASTEVAIVTVVGAGMRSTPGIAGKVFSSLGDRGVNVIAIAQGSSEVSISLVVDSTDSEAAVEALHNLIMNSSLAV